MKKETIVIVSVILSILVVAGVVGAGVVLAASSDSYPPIVQKLADKLNVNANDVDTAFDEIRDERRQEAQERFEERLNQAVKDGKITEEQKTTILEKQSKIQGKQEELMKLKQDLKNWADENNINLRDIVGQGFKSGRGPGRPRRGCFGPGL